MKYGEQPVGYTLPELQYIARMGLRIGIAFGFCCGVTLCIFIIMFCQARGLA
jgi:hypothetical protein